MSINSVMLTGEIDFIDIKKDSEGRVHYMIILAQIEEDAHVNRITLRSNFLSTEEFRLFERLRSGHMITIEGRLRVSPKKDAFYVRILEIEMLTE